MASQEMDSQKMDCQEMDSQETASQITVSADDICSICLNSMMKGEALFISACNHHFHFDCIANSVKAHNTECPLCRVPLVSLRNVVAPQPPTPYQIPLQVQQRAPLERMLTMTSQVLDIPAEDVVNEAELYRIFNTNSHRNNSRMSDAPSNVKFIEAKTTLEVGGVRWNQERNLYAMVSLKAPILIDENNVRVPLDLLLIVDRSNSMYGDKMKLLKRTLSYIVTQMKSNDRLSIVSFNGTADVISGLKMMNDVGKQRIENQIQNDEKLMASGSTDISNALKLGIELLNKRQTKNPLTSILLLTDGQDSVPLSSYTEIMSRLPPGTTCHTFGYGRDHKANILSTIAETSSGTFTHIDELNTIGNSYAHVLGGLFSCIAQNIEIKIELEKNYRITKIHSALSHSTVPNQTVTVKLNDLNADEKRDLVFEIHVPTVNEEEHLSDQIGHVALRYIDPASKQMALIENIPITLIRLNITDESILFSVNYDLDVQRNRVLTTKALKEAIWYAERGNMEQACKITRDVIDHIKLSMSSQNILCQELIEDLNNSIQKFQNDQQQFAAHMTTMSRNHSDQRSTYNSPHFVSSRTYVTPMQQQQINSYQSYSTSIL
ncbi:unnamed protein product [Didymodactylos carnosus]|uniref:Uncharacterized protein n=1 Tax=Didymodactylos carnosus TaxID=1234261 RepID=A0A814JA63_9BILA|nr:unnamed protein product [Didymodactylos carnosus]CAF1034748.1 unnamed protein product [Didymodactylos carnosus]CAF3529774.1 unnamed protein product [Didymodactylos carnosus]CAF3805413.1 unnamed protein product [Didymodactylos carnosus]